MEELLMENLFRIISVMMVRLDTRDITLSEDDLNAMFKVFKDQELCIATCTEKNEIRIFVREKGDDENSYVGLATSIH